MHSLTLADTIVWLETNPPLDDLRERFPQEWSQVERDVAVVLSHQDEAELAALADRASQPLRTMESKQNPRRNQELVSDEVRRRMTVGLIREVYVGLSSGVQGRVRLGQWNGRVLQRALFEQGLVRKPVSMKAFRRAWRMAWQRRRLMPLVLPQGIYCFYSEELIAELASMIGEGSTLEIAAGDGTLSRFLSDAGVDVNATDDHSWNHAVTYPESVKRQEATKALRAQQPEVVVCSWPPVGNKFERAVFETRSVQAYIVVTTRAEHAAGNWGDYRRQRHFEMTERPDLASLVLPPEVDPVVLVFERTGS